MRNMIGFEDTKYLQKTYALDTATFEAVKEKPDAAYGMAVALVDDATVGFGTSGDNLHGLIAGVEKDGFVTIRVQGYMEGVKIGTTAPAVGDLVAVDGAGGVVKSDATGYGPCVVRLETLPGDEAQTAVIKI